MYDLDPELRKVSLFITIIETVTQKFMKKIISLLFLFLPILGKSQAFDYEVSKPFPVVDAPEKHYFYVKDRVISIKHTRKQTIIQAFDPEGMKEVSRNVYVDFPDGTQFEDIQEFNDNIYFFYSVWDKPKTTEQLYVRAVDAESGKFADKGRRIIAVEGKVTNAMASSGIGWYVPGKFNIQRCFDETRILIQYRKKPEVRNDDNSYDVIGLHVFDDQMELISSDEVKMPYTEAMMNNLDYSIDAKGNKYVLALIYENDKQKLRIKDEISYHIELIRVASGSSEMEITKIPVEGAFLNDISLFNTPQDEMICAGFYSKSKRAANADGVITFKVNESGEIADMHMYEIPLEVLQMYMSERQQEKQEKQDDKDKAEFASLSMRELVVFEDGSMLLNGEQYYVVERTTRSSNGATRTTYQPYYNDILSVRITADGELAWMKKLGKRQRGLSYGSRAAVRQGGLSYEYFSNKGKNYFLYLDNVNNLDLTLNERPKYHQDQAGGFLTAYVVNDESGEITKESLFDMRDVKGIEVYQFQVNRIVQVSPTEFLVEVYKKKKEDIMIKITVRV